MSRVFKIVSMLSLIFTSLLQANEVQYISLPKDDSGDGLWTMVGVAGFDEDEYRIEVTSSNRDEYTAWYCEDERIKIAENVSDPKNSDYYTKLLFAIKVNNENIGSLTLNDEESNIVCNSGYVTSVSVPNEMAVELITDEWTTIGTSNEGDIKVVYPQSFSNAEIKFFLNDSPAEVFTLSLTGTGTAENGQGYDSTITGSTADLESIYTITKPIEETVDLYLNDNPGFGSEDTNDTNNYKREKSEYNPKFHRLPLTTDSDSNKTVLSEKSTLRIYTYNSDTKLWEFYNSDDESDVNTLTELQVGRGYWMKLDSTETGDDKYFFTLELNESYYSGESNLSFTDGTNSYQMDFSSNVVDTVVSKVNGDLTAFNTAFGGTEVNLSATAVSSNSILLVANNLLAVTETTDSQDAFKNVETSSIQFTSVSKVHSGLVLGDSHIKLKNNEIYKNIGKNGWNLLTLPTATIRESVTALVVDLPAVTDQIEIYDIFKAQVVKVTIAQSTVSTVAKEINSAIQSAITGEEVLNNFNVRVYPVNNGSADKLLFVSDDKFTLTSSGALTSVDVSGATATSSSYGDYILAFQTNSESQFVIDNKAMITFNQSIDTETDVTNITTLPSGYTKYSLDYNFDGDTTDPEDLTLITARSPFSVEDRTYTRTFLYSENNESVSSVNVYDGGSKLNTVDSIAVPVDTNTTEFATLLNSYNSSIFDVNSSGDYIFITGTTRTTTSGVNTVEDFVENIDIKESQDNEKDLLKDIPWIDNNLSKGALLKGYQGGDLARASVNDDGSVNSKVAIEDITSIPFRTLDLMSENALITLSDPDGLNRLPTMIIGSETNSSTGKVYWRTLNVTRSPSKWYENYNLFSTSNQKAYWVYLTDPVTEKPIEILGVDNAEDPEAPKVTKEYLRHFNNETGEIDSYPTLTIQATIKGIMNGETVEGYVSASLLNGGVELSEREFFLTERTVDTFTGYINSFDIEQITEDLTNDANQTENINKVLIRATDGRTYTDEFEKEIDLKRPLRPALNFNDQMNDLTVVSSDTDVDAVNQYLIFKDSVDDTTGININDTIDTPTNYLLSVPATAPTTVVTDLCQYVTTAELDTVKLLVIALDNEDETQANISDMEKINYIPFKNVHTLTAPATGETVKKPEAYGDDCAVVEFDSDDSGIQMQSNIGSQVNFVYKSINGIQISTGKPYSMRLKADGTTVATVTVSKAYTGNKFFIYYGANKLYEGTFTEGHDSETDAYELTPVLSGSFVNSTVISDQKIGN